MSSRSTLIRPLLAMGAAAAIVLSVSPFTATAADPAPLAARLLAEDFSAGGVVVSVSNMGGMAGLATDGVTVYMLTSSGTVVTTPLTSIPADNGSEQHYSATGTSHAVGWGVDGAPSLPGSIQFLSISYSHGCLFITNDVNVAGNVRLYCISTSDWSVTEIAIPDGYPLPIGYYYTFSSLIDFPDGRIGKVSQYTSASGGGYESTLRTYTVSGSGAGVTLAFS